MKTNSRLLWLGMFLMAAAAVRAQQLPQLPQFQPNTPARAAEVNANFETLRGGVNTNAAQLAASVTCPTSTPTRFTDKGDGTVCDSQTGLMWEIKTGTVGPVVDCLTPTDCPDPHDVNNQYEWTQQNLAPFTEPNGPLYSNFLARLNDLKTPNDGTATPCFAGHCDWRILTIGELRGILEAPFPNCTADPCIATGFAGPTAGPRSYWSSSSTARSLTGGWLLFFSDGRVTDNDKFDHGYARAVRGGR